MDADIVKVMTGCDFVSLIVLLDIHVMFALASSYGFRCWFLLRKLTYGRRL